MGNTLALVNAKLDEVISLLKSDTRPSLSQAEFARKAGLSRWTVNRYVKCGRVKSVGARIPFSELTKFNTFSSAESKGNNS